MLCLKCVVIFSMLNYVVGSNFADKVIKGGGYTAQLCLLSKEYNVTVSSSSGSFICSRGNDSCKDNGRHSYLCTLPCNFVNKDVLIDGKIYKLNNEEVPRITIASPKKGTVYNDDTNLTLKAYGDLSLLQWKDISIVFLNVSNVSCPIIEKTNSSLICRLKLGQVRHTNPMRINVNVTYGYEHCGYRILAGTIAIKRLSSMEQIRKYYHWIIIVCVLVVLLTVCACVFLVKIRKKNIDAVNSCKENEKKLEDLTWKYVNTQKNAFFEYQTAVDSFSDLGSLTPRHILSFYNFISRVFNVELPKDSSAYKDDEVDDFKEFLLNKDKLISWITKMERRCKIQQRSLVASLLTIVLFQHPTYFLEVMKCLLEKYIKNMKEKKEERIVFRKSEVIVEKLIGNWITLCMYRNLKTGEIGKRFFNLYRAIKCQINLGIVDCLTNKAKFALTYDHIMLGVIDCEVLNIKADVRVDFKMMSKLCNPLTINLSGLDVTVLSHDSVSQVKGKILDKAIMVYSEKENLCDLGENNDFSIALNDLSEFNLQFVNSTTQILLDDFDRTSVPSSQEKNTIMINTMKHYNMKSGTRFLLTSFVPLNKFSSAQKKPSSIPKPIEVHLQFPQNHVIANIEYQKQKSNENKSKILFNPVVEDMNKEAYLLLIMTTKKSILAFIDGFFQYIFNWNPSRAHGASSNSLFESEERPLLKGALTEDSQFLVSKETYLMPIYYLFSMFDDIARSLEITDEMAILIWKSNSFILRFWVNLIKNPNFIFSVDKTGPIDGSLTTIASVLMESCSVSASNTIVDVNLPIVKQLFHKELKKYSVWWRSFTESATQIEEASMVQMMQDIVETYGMANHYNSSCASLQAISNTLMAEFATLDEMSQNSQ